MARARCSASCCRATSRSSTRSTGASSTRCASASRATTRACAACRSSTRTGERYVRMAHLACVGSHAINGVAALHTELLEARRARATSTSCGRRSSATRPTASRRAASWPSSTAASRACSTRPSATAGSPISSGSAASSHWPTTRPSGSGGGASNAQNKEALCREIAQKTGVVADPVVAVRRPGQAHPRVQAPAPERAARRSRSTAG